MRKLAKFEKVTAKQFDEATNFSKCQNQPFAVVQGQTVCHNSHYDDLKLPKRATTGSCGYDFFSPFDITLERQQTATVPTGIRVLMPNNWALLIFPRSGLGFKFRLKLDNTVGVIDSDYCKSDNEGHIFVKITNEGDKQLEIKKGTAFCQGVFVPFGLTEDDDTIDNRNGGLGSTG